MIAQQQINQKAAQQPSFTAVQAGLLQRQCACGQHTGSGECEECSKKREGAIQRAVVSAAPVSSVSPMVHEVLNSPGQPLDDGTRAFMESRFGHDFSQVRVHNSVPVTLQAKLSVSQPGDKYEQEADKVAEQVMRMPAPESAQRRGFSDYPQHIHIQRMQPQSEEVNRQLETEGERKEDSEPTEEEESEEEEFSEPLEEEEGEENLQAKEFPGQTPMVSPNIHTQIYSLRGRGQPLSVSARAFIEPRFGYDFSQVRIHTDAQAAKSAQAVNALAYTVGRDVVFGAGQYAPGTEKGRRLLVHELTHVVQQTGHHGYQLQRQEAATEEPSFQLPEPTLQRPKKQPPSLFSAAERSAIAEYPQLIPFIHRNLVHGKKKGFEAYLELRCALLKIFGTTEQANTYYKDIEKTRVTFLGNQVLVHPDMEKRLVKAENWLRQNKGKKWLRKLKGKITSVGLVIRRMTGAKSTLSEHSFGMAIDINPIANPYMTDFPGALVKVLTKEDLFKGEAVKTVRERGKMADVLPAVEKLRTASETFKSRSKGMFKDEKSLKTELMHYLQGQRVAVKEDSIDKLFNLIKSAYKEKKSNAKKKKKAKRSYESHKALVSWLSGARTGVPTKEPRESIDFLVEFLMEAYQVFSATRRTGLAGVKQRKIATGHPEVVAAHGFINIQPELIAALVSSEGGGLRWLGTSEGLKDFMHFDIHPAPKPTKDVTAPTAPGCEPQPSQPKRTKQRSRHKKKRSYRLERV